MPAAPNNRDLERIRRMVALFHGARTPEAEFHWGQQVIYWVPALLAEVEQARAGAPPSDYKCPYCGRETVGWCDCPAPAPSAVPGVKHG